jgi:large subunit ribosomal protein L7/L12
MEKLTQEQLTEQLGNLTIPEIVALTKQLEQAWGVSATPQTVAVLPGTPDGKIPEVQTEFSVYLQPVSAAAKMNTIKLVREYLGLPLKESKEFVEGAPKLVKDGLSKADTDEAVAKFKAVGAEVEVK